MAITWMPAAAGLSAVCLALAGCASSADDKPVPVGGLGGATAGIPQTAIDVMNSAPYKRSVWSLAVNDAATGDALISYNADAFLEPASVTKTYSVGGGWLKFGPDSKIVTPVVQKGSKNGEVLSGDLVLVAKGDITMGGQTGPDGKIVYTKFDHNDANALPGASIADNNPLAGLDELAVQVKDSGISRVSGDVVIDDRLFETRDLLPNDGPVSPIVINNNVIDLLSTPGEVGAAPKVKMRPMVAPWVIDNRVKTVESGGRTAIEVDSAKNGVITMTGTIAADSMPALKIWNLTDPATFARTAFIEALERAGVQVGANPTAVNDTSGLGSAATVNALPQVAKLTDLTYEQNATYILKISYNRGAQTQICLLAVAAGSKDCDAGFTELAKLFSSAGIDPKNVALVDGSGLPGNFITANSQTQLQGVFASRPDAARWRAALPIMGVDGSLENVQKDSPAAGKVSAKTGTLAGADLLNDRIRLQTKALGGYMTAKSGRELTFAIIGTQAMFDELDGVFAANEDLGKISTAIWEKY